MNIEIYGAGFLNKGAQLMILAVMDAFHRRGIAARFAIDPREHADFDERSPLGIRQIFSLELLWTRGKYQTHIRDLSLRVEKWMPRNIAQRLDKQLGLVRRVDCDALIDISGYRYGDHWGSRPIQMFTRVAKDYRRRGKPVILMPQMFGPFDQPDVRRDFADALKYCTAVYARDTESLNHLVNAFGENAIYRKCPDITIGLCGSAKSEAMVPTKGGLAMIVPNQKVFENGRPISGEPYIEFLAAAFGELETRGYDVRFLIHESKGNDENIANRVIQRMGLADRSELLLKSADPLVLKAWLGQATVVLASRFHAAVSALSQGVPTVVVGWAHKYQRLMEDFGAPEWILTSEEPLAEFTGHLAAIESGNAETAAKLASSRMNCIQGVETCWKEVFALLPKSQ